MSTIVVERPDLAPDVALARLEEEVQVWGGAVDRDRYRLELPSQHGLRRGIAVATYAVERLGADGCRITITPAIGPLPLHWPSLLALLSGALGGLSIVLWPFFPRLASAMPLAFLVTFGAWFIVSSRIGYVGFHELADALEGPDDVPEQASEKGRE